MATAAEGGKERISDPLCLGTSYTVVLCLRVKLKELFSVWFLDVERSTDGWDLIEACILMTHKTLEK